MEKANKEVVNAGPMARATDVRLWLSPFVEPRDCLLGAALVTNIKMTATRQR